MFAPFGERVIFLGQVDEVALIEKYAMADLLVWPSINEAYGMALLEAQAAGLPVVAGRRRPGVADIVRERETGLLVPEGDAPAFAAAVTDLLTNQDRRAAFSIAARRSVDTHHGLAGAAATLD